MDHGLVDFNEYLNHSAPDILLEEAVSVVLSFSRLKKNPESGSLPKAINDIKTAHRTQPRASSGEWAKASTPAYEAAFKTAGGRRFVRVKFKGKAEGSEEQLKIGLVPLNTKKGDCIAILHGCRFPVVLEEQPTKPVCHKLVGDCYVQDIMFGEAVFWDEEEADKTFLI